MERYDVAVIGAGPAGTMAAKYASLAGAKTVVLEEHKSIGYPVQCAGLLGIRALEASELAGDRFLLNPFKGAAFVSPSGYRLSVKSSSIKAWVVDRGIFDRSMAAEAVRHGAEIMPGTYVRSVKRSNSTMYLQLAEKTISAKVVISAEGVKASIARDFGLRPPRRLLSGAQVEARFDVEDIESVEVHLGSSAPGLFAWVIPISRDYARIGLCSEENACAYLRRFLSSAEIKERLCGSPVGLVAGGLPLGPPPQTAFSGLLVVGDAAAQVKPTSGGGIYPGLICAKIAGRIAAEYALSGAPLERYDRAWRSIIGRELSIGMRVNDMLRGMKDGDLDALIRKMAGRADILRTIEDYGDIDLPSGVLFKLMPLILRDPELLRWLLKAIF